MNHQACRQEDATVVIAAAQADPSIKTGKPDLLPDLAEGSYSPVSAVVP
jgi:hypothetical protein